MTDEELITVRNSQKVKPSYCYIMKDGYFYRPECCGYTEFRRRAGIYETEDAISQARSCRDLKVVPVDLEEHNKMLSDEIQEMQSRIINPHPNK